MSNFTQGVSGPIRHAKIKLPKPNVWAKHPFRNEENHASLLEYLQQRLRRGADHRDSMLPRYVDIDKNIAGWMRLNDEDRKRKAEKERTGNPQATLINLPLTFVQIDDMMTFFAMTFAPNRGMFYHTGKPDEVGTAADIVTVMNNHAIYAGYYREVLLGIYSLLKYNNGGYQVFWSKESAPKLAKNAEGEDEIVTGLGWQGNRMESIDVYNFLADPQVHPSRLYCDGEFSAVAKIRSMYWLQNKAANGFYFNCEDELKTFNGISETTYYRSPPEEANMMADDSMSGDANGQTNWEQAARQAGVPQERIDQIKQGLRVDAQRDH